MLDDILCQYDRAIRNRDALAAMLAEGKGLSAFLFLTDRMADELEELRARIAELEARPQVPGKTTTAVGAPGGAPDFWCSRS